MSRPPARNTSSRPSAPAHCAENDCKREQAQAMSRLADVGEGMLIHFLEMKPTIEAMGEIIGKWLRFCQFVRKWFPRVGWWLLPIAVTLVTKGSSEAVDALIQAATTALLAQQGGAG